MINLNQNQTSEPNLQPIVLCDSFCDIDELKQIIMKFNPKIITFSLESHNFLLKNDIKHDLSESYLKKHDLDIIQDNSYLFSRWYSDQNISKSIEFDGINIGESFYIEFSHFLTPILKKIFEIKAIYTAHQNGLFFSSNSLVKFTKLFFLNVKILNNSIEYTSSTKKNKFFKFDKSFLIKNNQNYLINKIIKISYNLFNIFFKNKKIDPKKQTIFLINHTTKNFNSFFEQLPNYPINLVKYDTVVPAFWDFRSFLTIKKSKCYIEHSANLPNYILKDNSILDDHLKYILENEEFFNKFFTLDNYVFWNIIKKDFIEMYKKYFLIANQNIHQIKFLLKKYMPSYIIITSEACHLDLITVKIAQKFGIKIGIFQHALYSDDLKNSNYYSFKSDQFQKVLPSYSDNFLVWDKLTKSNALKHNVDSKKIISIGCPFYDMFFDNNKNIDNLKEEYVLLAITPITFQNTTRELSTEIQIEYQDTIKEICKIMIKMNKKLIIKVHHGASFDKKIVSDINQDIIVKDTGSFYEYAKNCELLICVDMSTAILEAMFLKKPIVSILIKDKDSDSEFFKNNYTLKTEIHDLEKTLIRIFSDNEFKIMCVEKGEKFIHDYLLNPGNSTKTLLDFLSYRS